MIIADVLVCKFVCNEQILEKMFCNINLPSTSNESQIWK